MTYSTRGYPRRDLSLYLKQEEYMKLEEMMDEIMFLSEQLGPSNLKRTVMQGYKWKITDGQGNKLDNIADCQEVYYTVQHAETAGHMVVMEKCPEHGHVSLEREYVEFPNEPVIMEKIYLTSLFHMCRVIRDSQCVACMVNEPVGAEAHKIEGGCKDPERNFVRDFLPTAMKVLADKKLVEIFNQVCKILGMHIPAAAERDKLVEHLHYVMEDDDDDLTYVKHRLSRLFPDTAIPHDPQIMVIQDVLSVTEFPGLKTLPDLSYDEVDAALEEANKTPPLQQQVQEGGEGEADLSDRKTRKRRTALKKEGDTPTLGDLVKKRKTVNI
jgi:hypothetical protein